MISKQGILIRGLKGVHYSFLSERHLMSLKVHRYLIILYMGTKTTPTTSFLVKRKKLYHFSNGCHRTHYHGPYK